MGKNIHTRAFEIMWLLLVAQLVSPFVNTLHISEVCLDVALKALKLEAFSDTKVSIT